MKALKIAFSVAIALLSIVIAISVLNVGETRFQKVLLACVVEIYAVVRGSFTWHGYMLVHVSSLISPGNAFEKGVEKRLASFWIDAITLFLISVLALVALVRALYFG